MACRIVSGKGGMKRRGILSGFTLIELLVVLAIIATLMSIAAPRYFEHLDRSREASLRQTLSVVRDAIDRYHADIGKWPPDLDTLVTKRYLRKLPVDPITERNDSWLLVAAPGEEEAGVWDLHSGAEGTAKDGTSLAEW
ncbi:Putative type II secretion system protein G [Aromatoleum petrolei]|nr:Putative type II secretion system protein G [Aromatoleum petrolei]